MNFEKINELIATKILGLPETSWDENTPCPFCGRVGRFCGGRSWCECGWYYSAYKPYSEEIQYAWEVVEKMHEEEWLMELTTSKFIEKDIGGADCSFKCKAQARGRFYAEANDAPMAICLAALETLGIKP